MNTVDIIIPTCKPLDEVLPLIKEARTTAGMDCHVIATCQPVCAAKNRNMGLEQATSPIRIMIDDDLSDFPNGWARDLVKMLEAYPECVMASPQLMQPEGGFALMMGNFTPLGSGIQASSQRELLTACVAFRESDLRFNEDYKGSGWEDTQFSAELRQRYPDGVWLINHDIKVVHANEMKNQAEHFSRNRDVYKARFGDPV